MNHDSQQDREPRHHQQDREQQQHPREQEQEHWTGWRSLLLRWVNCLKVTGNLIKELDELKNCKILQCLIEKKTLSNLDQTCDSGRFVNDFLKKRYPFFEISDDLDDTEIVELTSLLIHYFCLKIKDDFIMKAMCKNLSTEDQTDIMQFVNFLMNVSNISNQSIREAIEETISNSLSLHSANSNNYFSPHGLSYSPATFTSVSASSPILTPHSLEKSRSRGRRRRINKLEVDLETEKFEKNCLQEEVNDLKKEVQDLVKIQNEYKNTISRLRTEIDISNNSNCNEMEDDKNDALEFQNCLRKEISSLENELLKAMGENGQLHEERDNLRKQILSMEQNLQSWKTKAVTLEQSEEYLKNQLNTKTIENAELKISLLESNKFLEEYRQQNLMNVSVECDDDSVSLRKCLMSPASPGEPLNEVVEVQLREQLVKNQILTDTVDSLKSEKENFEDKCRSYEEQLRENDLKIDTLKSAIEQFEKEMCEFAKCKIELDDNAQKLKAEIEFKQKICNRNIDLQSELDKVKTELNILHKTTLDQTSIIEDLSQKNEDYKMDLFNHTVAITNNEKDINEKLNYINQLTGQLDQLENIRNSLEIRFNELEAHSKQQINLLQKTVDEKEKVLENQRNIHESEILNKVNEINTLHQELVYKSTELTEVKASYQAVESEMINKQSVISQMTKEIDRLNQMNAEYSKNIEINDNFLKNLNKSFEKQHKDIRILEENMSSKDNFIEIINKKNEQLTTDILELKDEKINLQNQATVSLQTVEALKSKIDSLEKQLETESKNYQELLHEKDEIVERNEELNSQIENLKVKLQKETEMLKEKNTSLNSRIAQLTSDIFALELKVETITRENDDALKENNNIQGKYNNLQNILLDQEKEISAKNSEISACKISISEKDFTIKSHEEENTKLKIEVQEKIENSEHLNQQIKVFTENIADLEKNLELKTISLTQFEEKFSHISEEKLSLTEELTVLMSEKNIIFDEGNAKVTKLEEEINILKKMSENYKIKIDDHIELINNLNADKSILEKEISGLKTDLESGKNEKIVYQNEIQALHTTIKSLEDNIQANSKKSEKNESEIAELTIKNDEIKNTVLQLENIIADKTATYNECVDKLTEKDLHILQIESELKEIKASNNAFEIDCQNLNKDIEVMKLEDLKRQDEIIELQDNITLKEKLLEEISKKLESLENENIDLKTFINETKKCVSAKEDAIADLKLQLSTLEEDSSKSKLETEQLRTCLLQKDEVLEDKESQIKHLIQESDELNNIVDKIMSEYQQDSKFNGDLSRENSICEDFTSLEYIDGHSTEFKKPLTKNFDKDLKQKLTDIHKSFESITKTCAHIVLEKEDIIENAKSSIVAEIENNKILQADKEEILHECNEQRKIVESLTCEVEDLQSQIQSKDKVIEDLNELQRERDVLVGETTLLTEINNTLENNIEQLRTELNILKQNEQSLQTSLYSKIQIITDIDDKNKTYIINIKDALKNCLNEIISSVEENNFSLQELLINMDETESFENVVSVFDDFTKRLLALINWLVEDRANLREKLMVSATCDDTKLGILNTTLRDSDCFNISGEVSSTTLGLSATKSENTNIEDLKIFASEIEESNLILRYVVDANKSNRKKTQELKNMFDKMQNTILISSTNQNTLANALNKISEWEDKIHFMEQNGDENNEKLYNFIEKFYTWIDNSIQSICKNGRKEDLSSEFSLNSDLQILCNQSYTLKDRLNKTKLIFKEIENQNMCTPSYSGENEESSTLRNNAIYNILEERCNLKEEMSSMKNEHLSLQKLYQGSKSENEELINKICNLREILKNMETEHMKILKSTQESEMENKLLKNENTELNEKVKHIESNNEKRVADSRKVDTNQLVNDMRLEYEDKLNRMKQKMKQIYQDEINKITEKHSTKDTLEMESILKKYVEKINSYEQHVNQLSSQLWKVGEKLLMEKNEKEFLKKQLRERSSSQQSLNSVKSLPQTTNSVDEWRKKSHQTLPRNSISRLPEYANQKPPRLSISIPKIEEFKVPLPSKVESGGLHVSDEEGEIFDNTYLTAMKMGVCEPKANSTSTNINNSLMQPDRLSELQWRNSLCLPHLKSSYPVEMQFNKHREDDIKTAAEKLNESIAVEKLRPKKEVGQTTYKKPGPPTPSKNGGRLSLQGNDGREPLKEYNDNTNNTKKTTPSRLKSLFMSNNSRSSSKDENTLGTPKSKRLSIFRRQR